MIHFLKANLIDKNYQSLPLDWEWQRLRYQKNLGIFPFLLYKFGLEELKKVLDQWSKLIYSVNVINSIFSYDEFFYPFAISRKDLFNYRCALFDFTLDYVKGIDDHRIMNWLNSSVLFNFYDGIFVLNDVFFTWHVKLSIIKFINKIRNLLNVNINYENFRDLFKAKSNN